MTQKVLRDVGASARQRLLNLAHWRKEDFQLVLSRYATERLLFRLSRSDYRDRFVVKGATLFTLWTEGTHRPTRDLDLLGLDAGVDLADLEGFVLRGAPDLLLGVVAEAHGELVVECERVRLAASA